MQVSAGGLGSKNRNDGPTEGLQNFREHVPKEGVQKCREHGVGSPSPSDQHHGIFEHHLSDHSRGIFAHPLSDQLAEFLNTLLRTSPHRLMFFAYWLMPLFF